MSVNPCYNSGKDCSRRCVGCKSTCESYIEWEKIHQKEKEELKKAKQKAYIGSSRYFYYSENQKRECARQHNKTIKSMHISVA